jgi:uncharacterized protein YukJ
MPVSDYGLLRGSVIDAIPYKKGADHYQIEVQAAGKRYRIAVDVYSQMKGGKKHYSSDKSKVLDVDREVMFYKDEGYSHPILAALGDTEEGMTSADDLPEELRLDYVRTDPALFPLDKMTVVPPKDERGNGDDLNDDIDPVIQKAKNNPDAEVFAFGSAWDDSISGKPDPTQYFHPNPSLGIHDIHMNQGDTGSEAKYNGVWQDGALLVRFAANDKEGKDETWTAMFFRFQNQSTDTDDNGDPQ